MCHIDSEEEEAKKESRTYTSKLSGLEILVETQIYKQLEFLELTIMKSREMKNTVSRGYFRRIKLILKSR